MPIGSFWSVTGPFAQFGIAADAATSMAVDEINEEGFVVDGARYTFELFTGDGQSEASTGVSVVRRLIERDGVIAIFGPTTTPLALPSAEITQPAGVIQFTPPTGVQGLIVEEQDSNPYLFNSNNAYGGDSGVVTQLARAAYEDYGVETVVMLNVDDAAARAYAPIFEEAFEAAGGEVLASEYVPRETTDFTPFISTFESMEPEGFFFGYSDAFMVPLMTQARQADLAEWYIAGPGSGRVPAEESGDDVYQNYIWAPTILDLNDPQPAMQDWIDRYEEYTGESVNSVTWTAMLSYPFVYAFVQAMQNAGTVDDVDAIVDALKGETFTLDGPIPSISFNENGQASATFQVCDLATGDISCEIINP